MAIHTIDITDYLNSPAQEAFRVLSSNLGFSVKKQNLKTVLITSYRPGEGKTSVTINLAIASAKAGRNVLYVDADLRKANRKKRHWNASIKGLTDFESDINEVISLTAVNNLQYVTAGTRSVDSIEFLNSKRFDNFLKDASKHYDIVFIDSPSLGHAVDGSIIASKVSGSLIVTRANHTRYRNIEQIKWFMNNVGANIIGIVLNRIDRREYKSYFLLQNHFRLLAPDSRRRGTNISQ
ncbi:CpsD/CapB family tyrosine-protein kinase [Dehalobacter sp. TBBPA1]|uniref:CpsD/CapB family tyrosine-protein kinase n=1 Tax=Dehalobacter sp. TBBPA1 TaxID=3235037 RepID=UPI0034A2C5D2